MSSQIVVLLLALAVALVVLGAVLVAARRGRGTERRRGAPATGPERAVAPLEERHVPASASVERPAPPRPQALRPLPAQAQQRYLEAWEGVQTRFADRPVLALSEADALLTRLLADRGLPADARAPQPVHPGDAARALEEFRAGHAIEQQNSSVRANPEQVDQGMQHFRAVFAALIRGDDPYPSSSEDALQRQTR